jgi:O-antigen/teichoic acid export membrane protein
MKNNKMTSIKTTARIAGFLYLFQIPLGVFGILYVPKMLMVTGNMASTASNILANEFLFRLSIVSAILCALVTIATALYIYKVLKFVNENYAKWILLFILIAAPISMLNELNSIVVLLLLKSHEYAIIFTPSQLHNLVSIFLDLHKYGHQIAGIFFGLWLLPMGYLVFKSTYIPKIIGVFLIVTCLGYLIDFTTFFLYPNFGIIISEYTWAGEVLMVLWLLVKGVNVEKFKKWNQESLNIQPERTQ